MGPRPIRRAVAVWDPVVRLFHWSLVGCVLSNQFVLEAGEPPHEWVGYTAAVLVALRLLWGVVGTRHARFADWFPTPARLRAHGRGWRRGEPDGHPGHNPVGALMMLLLMALVLALGLTGWMQGTDRYFGEAWLMALHEWLARTLLAAAGLHAAAALVVGRRERVRLVRAMVTGVKEYY